MDIGHRVSDHLFRNRARDVLDGFLELVDGCRLSLAHIIHGVGPEELFKGVEVRAVGVPLGYAADYATPKLCVEPCHDLCGHVAHRDDRL